MRWLGALTALLLISCSTVAGYLRAQHYAELELAQGAAAADVRAAYRRLALKLHPDKNPSQAAAQRWLRVQKAYEALTQTGTSGSLSSAAQAGTFEQRQQQQQQQEARTASSRFWRSQQQQAPPPIPSDTESLDAASFHRRVLAADTRASGAGGAWLLQVYADSSPYCRALSPLWEKAAVGMMGPALVFARIDAAAHPMLVRFLSSHLHLFRTPLPASHDLPAVFGLPSGCTSMACAVVYTGRFSTQGLQHFAGTALLQLTPLPPLSRRLLGVWLARAHASGRVALLALLPDGQAPPAGLTSAVAGAKGRVQAAYAAWKSADNSAWAAATGATAAPALVFWDKHSGKARVVQSASIDYAAAVAQHSRQAVPQLHAGSLAELPACQISSGSAAAGGVSVCVVLLGRGGQQALAQGRGTLQDLHQQLTSAGSSSRKWCNTAEGRHAAKALAAEDLQLAWADSAQQAQLCRHLLRWSGSSASSACLCGSWWQRLPLALCRRCSLHRVPPILVAFRQQQQPAGHRRSGGNSEDPMQLMLASFGGSLADSREVVAWLAALVGTQAAKQPPLDAVLHPAPSFASQLAGGGGYPPADKDSILTLIYHASRAEVVWRQTAAALASALAFLSWRTAAMAGAAAGGALGLKYLLDVLSDDDEGLAGGHALASNHADRSCGQANSGDDRGTVRSRSAVQQMRQCDWQPSPGRYVVLLLLPDAKDSGAGSPVRRRQDKGPASADARPIKLQFATLAAAFERERRLCFRLASVSAALTALLHFGGRADEAAAATLDPLAVVLHPSRNRFQVVYLVDLSTAVTCLEVVLDGGGQWREGLPL